ncbi:MAG: hypothetical protein ABW167_05240 [Baekduia sp.]
MSRHRFNLVDRFTHRDGRTIIVSSIVHDPPISHDIMGSDAGYDAETVVWTVPKVAPADVDGRELAALKKHTTHGNSIWTGQSYTHDAWDRADWGRVAERHAAILKRARRGRRRVAATA